MKLPLPTVIIPNHETILPSSGLRIKFRQFLVGEEKILLIALEDGTEEAYIDALKLVLERVLITTDVDIENLPMVDIEHIFLQLRKHSVGEIIELKYVCKNILTKDGIQKQCGSDINVDIPIGDIKVENTNLNKTIMLHEDIGVVMKYPKFKTLQKIMKLDSNNTQEIFGLIGESIDNVFHNGGVERSFTREQLDTFLDSLPGGCLDKILEFLSNTPYHHYETEFKCPRCGNTGKLEYQGLKDFFE